MADLKRLMLGYMFAVMSDLATATAPEYGTQAGNPNCVASSNMDKLSTGASVMAVAAVGKGNPGSIIDIVEIEIL